jgi:hypothetical protein
MNLLAPPAPSSHETPAPKGTAANGPSLWRTILDTHGREILECASDQFLDLAIALRLETISARDLVELLAKAGRLGYMETDIIESDAVDPLAREADKGLDASFSSTLPTERTGQGCSDSTPSLQPSLVEASRKLKRRKTDERESLHIKELSHTTAHPVRLSSASPGKYGGNSVMQRSGGVKTQKLRLTSAVRSGNSQPGSAGVKDADPRSGNAIKRPDIQRGPALASDAKQSQGISAQHIELVVITDSEPESSEDDKK